MSQKINLTKHIIAAGLLIISAMAFVSCEKYTWDPPKVDPNIPVSFKNEIIPIFSTKYSENKSCIDCHMTNPDFHANKLWATLNDGLIDLQNPDQSAIILKLYGSHSARCSEENKQKLKIWILQGAIDDSVNK